MSVKIFDAIFGGQKPIFTQEPDEENTRAVWVGARQR
jgi:hypothetical protein